jgi:hypothetical protein
MAFLDDTEATTYRMLQQVLQNHYTAYTLCLPHTLVACGALVALVCAQRDETRDALEPAVAHTLADLKRYTRARWSAPPLAPFPVECPAHDTPAHLAQSEAVFQALAQFLHDSLAAERVTPSPCKTRFQPAGEALTGQDLHLLGSSLAFQGIACDLLSHRARLAWRTNFGR